MRTMFNLTLIAIGIWISVMVPSDKTAAIANAKGYPHNLAVVHIARPEGMKTLPVEVVPLP
jgi:hypothetical protein